MPYVHIEDTYAYGGNGENYGDECGERNYGEYIPTAKHDDIEYAIMSYLYDCANVAPDFPMDEQGVEGWINWGGEKGQEFFNYSLQDVSDEMEKINLRSKSAADVASSIHYLIERGVYEEAIQRQDVVAELIKLLQK